MSDREFLEWLRDRLVHVYGESLNVDFVQRLGKIAGQSQESSTTLERYGLQWNGPDNFVATPMADGYWTPWHIANQALQAAQARAVCPHVVKSGTTSWCRLAQSSQAQAGKPIAAVRGYYNGMCVVDTVGDENVLPVGMALYSQPQAQAGAGEATIQRLRGQLQNCVNHIERLKRHHPRETEKLEACVQSANNCLYETLCDTAPPAAVNQQLLEALQHIMKMQTFGYIVLGEEATTKARTAIAAAQEQSK